MRKTNKAMKNFRKLFTRVNEKDLVSFGNYLLSDKRLSSLNKVTHADIENWRELNKDLQNFN